MNDKQATEAYYKARNLLKEVIASGHRGDREEVLMELEDDLIQLFNKQDRSTAAK